MTFQRQISKVGLFATAVGSMVGSGWLLGPLYTAQFAGPAAVLSWIIGGVLMMIIALTFAELSTMFPVAGGMLRFTHFSHGAFVSFMMAWVAWLAAVIVAPIETMALLQYASNYIPHLFDKAHSSAVLTPIGIGVAACIMLLMCILNILGIKWVARTNIGITFWKLLIPIITIIILLTVQFRISNFFAFGGFIPSGWHGVLAALPSAGVIFSFIGYSPAIQLSGEAKNPQRAIPIAILGSLAFCIILYSLLQFTFIGAVDPAALSHGWNQLHFKNIAGPFAGIMTAIGIIWFVKIIYLDAIISPLGTGIIYTSATARMNYAASKNDYAPKMFLDLNKRGVPANAIFINFIIGLIFILPFPSWQRMVGIIVSIFVFAYGIGPIALMSLRYQHPNLTRPFKIPFAPLICLLAFYICNLLLFWTGWQTIVRMLIILLVGFIYFISQTIYKKELVSLKNGIWLFPYVIGLGIISYLGSYGGGLNVIPFGWDFLILALFSIICFVFAINKNPTQDTLSL